MRCMLVIDQDERITMAQVIEHPYLTRNGECPIMHQDVIEREVSEESAQEQVQQVIEGLDDLNLNSSDDGSSSDPS